MVCIECGEIFNKVGYKVIVQVYVAQEPSQEIKEGKEVPAVEPNDENEPELDIILDLELGEDEKMKSQPVGDTEVLLDHSHFSRDIEVTQEKPQQSKEIEKQEAVTQELASLEMLV